MILDRFKLAARLLLIVAGAGIGISAVGGFSLFEIRQNLFEDRKIKTQHVVQVAESLLGYYHALEKAGGMTRDEAQKASLAALATLRYDEQEYFWVQSLDNVMLMHPFKPEMDGKPLAGITDPNGIKLFDEMVAVSKRTGHGFVEYAWPKPGFEKPVPKVSYVQAFAPWQWIVGSGIYVDDVDAIFMRVLAIVGTVAAVILIAVVGASWAIGRGITKPLAYITASMRRLAEGDKSIEVKFTDQKNEIGDLARSMDVFLAKTLEMDRMREEQLEAERRTEKEKRQAMLTLADTFEASVGKVVNQVSSAATEMHSSSEAMGATAEEATRQASAVAAASEQASANVQTVAAATEELSSSIGEISRQVTQASQIAAAAVSEAEQTNLKVQGLAQAANKIGEVVALITDIA
ncbi:MAG: methyl-accepting chemotaxis protein, partial [Rhodospirillales bacterium]|nr:methyl-accepting chemotaxis protein [Rhodospirillales bacterium]